MAFFKIRIRFARAVSRKYTAQSVVPAGRVCRVLLLHVHDAPLKGEIYHSGSRQLMAVAFWYRMCTKAPLEAGENIAQSTSAAASRVRHVLVTACARSPTGRPRGGAVARGATPRRMQSPTEATPTGAAEYSSRRAGERRGRARRSTEQYKTTVTQSERTECMCVRVCFF